VKTRPLLGSYRPVEKVGLLNDDGAEILVAPESSIESGSRVRPALSEQ
jgi:hypothetical protein